MELNTEIKTVLDELRSGNEGIKTLHKQMESEIKNLGSAQTETKNALDQLLSKEATLRTDLNALTVKFEETRLGVGRKSNAVETPGALFTGSDGFKALDGGRKGHNSGLVSVKSFHTKAVTSDAASAAAGLPQATRLPLFTDPKQELMIRDLLRVVPTTDTSIEFVRYTFTNNAATIYSSSPSPTGTRENILKPMSDMTFVLDSEKVETIAHLVPASKQILADIPNLQNTIDTELIYGLKKVEETELLYGAGTPGHLNGLATQAAAFDSSVLGAGPTKLDKLRAMVLQARKAQYPVDAFVLNPEDWFDIETTKDSNGRYIVGDPTGMIGKRLWGRTVVEADSLVKDHALAGAFGMAAILYDREQANVETSNSHEDYFRRNMIAIRAEERVCLVVTRPQAFVYGSI